MIMIMTMSRPYKDKVHNFSSSYCVALPKALYASTSPLWLHQVALDDELHRQMYWHGMNTTSDSEAELGFVVWGWKTVLRPHGIKYCTCISYHASTCIYIVCRPTLPGELRAGRCLRKAPRTRLRIVVFHTIKITRLPFIQSYS